jgi:hypothetical protein
VSTEEKTWIDYESATSILQVPDYPNWKKNEIQFPVTYTGHLYENYMNRSKCKISGNGGKIRCALYGKPCNILTKSRSNLKGLIVITNKHDQDFFVDKYTELGTLVYGYDDSVLSHTCYFYVDN